MYSTGNWLFDTLGGKEAFTGRRIQDPMGFRSPMASGCCPVERNTELGVEAESADLDAAADDYGFGDFAGGGGVLEQDRKDLFGVDPGEDGLQEFAAGLVVARIEPDLQSACIARVEVGGDDSGGLPQ